MEALIFGTNRRAIFLQACVFARIIDAVHFFIISLMLLFRRDQHNRTLVLYAFPAVSLAEMGRSEVEICFAAVMLSSARARASTMPYRPNAARWQISFNACNQLWNADRLGKKCICGADRRKRLFWYDLSPIGERHCLWKCREKNPSNGAVKCVIPIGGERGF